MWEDKSETNVLISEIIGILRDKDTPPALFRENLKRLGNYLAYEVGTFLGHETKIVISPLGEAKYKQINEKIVVITILRAALPMSEGVIEVFPHASVGVVSASRGKMIQEGGKDFRIDGTYMNIPFLEDKIAIVVDPMLASGSTILFLLNQVKQQKPKQVIILCAIAAKYGIERILKEYPDAIILAGAVDHTLNEKGYIVPGLGDAGDRAFNT